MADTRNDNNNDTHKLSATKLALLEKLKAKQLNAHKSVEKGKEWQIQPIQIDEKPLAIGQKRIWFFDQLKPESPAYNIPLAFLVRGNLDINILERSLQEIIKRHSILRARFEMHQGEPRIEINEKIDFRLHHERLAADQDIDTVLRKEAIQTFALSEGHLIRASLFEISQSESILTILIHHIVADGWSVGIILNELKTCYEAFKNKREPALPALAIQYVDYAKWQNDMLAEDQIKQQIDYWKQQLEGATKLYDFPLDRSRPKTSQFLGDSLSIQIPQDLVESLKELSTRENVTLYMLLVSAYQILLSRYTGQKDINIGIPVANRNRPELEPLIGFFVNTLVLRINSSSVETYRELLQVVRQVMSEAYDNQDAPFEKIIEELGIERDLSYSPLFQTMLALNNSPLPSASLGEIELSPLHVKTDASKFDMTLELWWVGNELRGRLDYSTEIFYKETIQKFFEQFTYILQQITENKELKLSDISLITESEKKQLIDLSGYPDLARQETFCLHQRFEEQVRRNPDAIALTFNREQMTYRELDSRANQVANYLLKHGMSSEALVGIYLDRSMEMMISILGILKAGGAYVPIDLVSPKERISFILADTQVPFILTTSDLISELPDTAAKIICLDSDLSGTESTQPANVHVRPDQLAYIIFTSGSTGNPKGVLVEHRHVARLFSVTESFYQFNDQDVWALFHSYAFDFSVWEMWGPLLYGGRLVIVPYLMSRTPQDFLRLLAQEGITVLNQTPTAFKQLILAESTVAEDYMSTLRFIIFGGESLEPYSLKAWFDRHPGRQTRLVNMYGITEITVHATLRPIVYADTDEAKSYIGNPLGDLQFYLLDDNQQPVPVGIPGEIYIGGAGVARGYLHRPELNEERFINNPFAPGTRLYRTGDLARRSFNGDIEYIGRKDMQVKIRGFRIELSEIAHHLMKHPDIRNTAVVVHDEPNIGKRIVAYVVPNEQRKPSVQELRVFLGESLPEYMIPNIYLFMTEIPTNQNGKVDTSVLKKYEFDRSEFGTEFVLPRTETERILASIWKQTLGRDEIGIDDNFFALGGDSIRAIQVVALAKEQGLQVELQQLFQHQQIRTLAEATDQTKSEQECPKTKPFHGLSAEDVRLLPADVVDAHPLTQLQLGMLYHMEYSADSTSYHNTCNFRIRGPFQAEALQQAINEIVRRNVVLRSSFDFSKYSEALQLVHREAFLELYVADIRHLTPSEQEATLQQWNREELTRRFDLSRPPLIRFYVHRVHDDIFYFGLTECHAIIDGWSLTSIIKEIFEIYLNIIEHKDIAPFEEPALSFRDFVWWERDMVASEEMKDYWHKKMDQFEPTMIPRLTSNLQLEKKRSFQRKIEHIPADLHQEMKRLSNALHVPLKTLFLAAHLKVLSILNNRDDVVTGVVMNGRPETMDGERMRGLFLNTIPFRQKVHIGSWKNFIRETFENELEMLPYRRYPMSALQKSLGEQNLFETSFNFVHFRKLKEIEEMGAIEFLDILEEADTNFTLQASFSILPMTGEIVMMLDTNGMVVTEEQGHQIAEYYLQTLSSMVRNPDDLHHQFSVLTEQEKEQVLVEWNQTDAPYPSELCVHEWFEQQVALTPDATAITDGVASMTYSELNAEAERIAQRLGQEGVGVDQLVGICMERSAKMMAAVLGILKAGGAYVPLDPTYPAERLAFILQDSQAKVLITEQKQCQQLHCLQEYAGQLIVLDEEEQGSSEQERTANEPHVQPVVQQHVQPHHLAYVIYTSGSTGQPKGVMIEHRNVVNYLSWAVKNYEAQEGSGSPLHSSLSFDLTVTSMFIPLLTGKTIRVIAEEQQLEGLYESLMENRDYSVVKLTPAHLNVLNTLLSKEGGKEGTRTLVIGGEPLFNESLTHWQKHAPETRIYNEYGPTETTVGRCVYEVSPTEPAEGPVPIGRPIQNTKLYILDEQMNPVPIGVSGELYIGGAGVARGYLNRPELTQERFVANPFGLEGDRLYRTGDWVRYRQDGQLEYIGRRDQQIKLRGYRIELGEIEALLVQCPGVRANAVVIKEGDRGEKQLVAYLVREHDQLTSADVRAYVEQRLPAYMIPSLFIFQDALPLTANGKIDREALVKLEIQMERQLSEMEGPRNEVERKLVSIWNTVLGRTEIGIHDNFFQLGGDSIIAFQVVSKASAEGIHFKPVQLFEYSTVARLAQVVEIREVSNEQDQEITGEVPTTPIHQWFLEQGIPNRNHYNQSMFLQVPHDLSKDQLEKIVDQLLAHHDALRLRLKEQDCRASMWIAPHGGSLPVNWNDVAHLSGDKLKEEIEFRAKQMQESLDLEQGPIMNVGYFYCGEDQPAYLLIVVHHIAIDGVSWRILLEDWQTAYDQVKKSEPIQLPPKTTSFKQWAELQQHYVASSQVIEEVDYWTQQHDGISHDIPLDFPDGVNSIEHSAQYTVTLDVENTDRLLKGVHKTYRTQMNDILLASFLSSMSKWLKRSKLVVELEGHGREDHLLHADLSRTMGWFTSIFPILLHVQNSEDPEQTITSVKEQLRSIPKKGMSYGILRYLSEASTLKAMPKSAIRFNYLGQYTNSDKKENEIVAPYYAGPTVDPAGELSHLLGIDGLIMAGELQFTWTYSRSLFKAETVEMLAKGYLEELKKMIQHCIGSESVVFTPSDFPNARLSAKDLQNIVKRFSRK